MTSSKKGVNVSKNFSRGSQIARILWIPILGIAVLYVIYLLIAYTLSKLSEVLPDIFDTVSPWWTIIILVVVLIYFFRNKINYSRPSFRIGRGEWAWLWWTITAFAAFMLLIHMWNQGIVPGVAYLLRNGKDAPASYTASSTGTTSGTSLFAGMTTLSPGPITVVAGKKYRIEVIYGVSQDPYPETPGTYDVTLFYPDGITTLCSTRIIKHAGKDPQFIPLIQAPRNVDAVSYVIQFSKGGKFELR